MNTYRIGDYLYSKYFIMLNDLILNDEMLVIIESSFVRSNFLLLLFFLCFRCYNYYERVHKRGDDMPKIVENVRQRILLEAKKQLEETGYGNMTIRSIALGCGIGVGTIYNYFSSKDVIVASFILDDWLKCLDLIKNKIACGDDVLMVVYNSFEEFILAHDNLFSDEKAIINYRSKDNKWHFMLREQLADIINLVCNDDFKAFFIAEAIITWCLEKKSYSMLAPILKKIIL